MEKYQENLPTEEDISGWSASLTSDIGVGVVCGSVSGNLEVIDFDSKVENIEDIWAEFMEQASSTFDVSELYVEKTQNGGFHVAYLCESEVDGNRKLATINDKVVVETRGQGGYCIVAPSTGYEVLQGSLLELPLLTTDQRNSLIEICLSFSAPQKKPAPKEVQSSEPHKTNMLENPQIKKHLDEVSTASDGEKHEVLLRKSNLFGHLVAEKKLTKQEAQSSLLKAIQENNGRIVSLSAAEKTIREGLEHGELTHPRQVDGKKKRSIAKVISFLKDNFNLSRDELTGEIYDGDRRLEEKDINTIYLSAKKQIGVSMADLITILNSAVIPAFNRIQSFLIGLPSPNSDRQFRALHNSTQLKNPDDQSLFEIILRKWLIGMVAAVYDDNYNPLMLILVGPKNIGKTEFFRRLLPAQLRGYYAEYSFQDNKDTHALLCEKLLVVNDELDSLSKADVRVVRKNLSASSFTYRPAYGRKNLTKKRLASMAGTSNESEIIDDVENNRRLIPFEITGIDYEAYNSIDKDELMAWAQSQYRLKYDWNLNRKEVRQISEHCYSFRTISSEEELVQRYFNPPNSKTDHAMTITEIQERIAKVSFIKLNNIKLGRALTNLKYPKKTIRNGSSTSRVYLIDPII